MEIDIRVVSKYKDIKSVSVYTVQACVHYVETAPLGLEATASKNLYTTVRLTLTGVGGGGHLP